MLFVLLPKPNPLDEVLLVPLLELPDCALDELLDVALAVDVAVRVCVAASVVNAMKQPSVTPRDSFFNDRTFSSACALGMRAGAERVGVAGCRCAGLAAGG